MVIGWTEKSGVKLGKDIPLLGYNCLFCPDHRPISEDTPLEHVFPISWGGDLFVGSFSCASCNNLMSRFERILWRHPVRLQGLLGNQLQFDITGRRELQVPEDPWQDIEMFTAYRSDYIFESNRVREHNIRKPMGRLAAKVMLCTGAVLQPNWFYDGQFDGSRSFVLKGVPNLVRERVIIPSPNRPFNPSDVHYIIVTHLPNQIFIEVLFFGHYGIGGIFPVRYLKREHGDKPEVKSIVFAFNIRDKSVGFKTYDTQGRTIIGPIFIPAPLEITRQNLDTYYDNWLHSLSGQ